MKHKTDACVFQVNGIMNMVFAYGGAMIFPEFLAEMRRPMDFWKGMVWILPSFESNGIANSQT